MSAACSDPYRAYACDGDHHWTLELIRDWWANRARLTEWLDKPHRNWDVSGYDQERQAEEGLRAYKAYLHNGLEPYLREYAFWLETGRPATPTETLPDL